MLDALAGATSKRERRKLRRLIEVADAIQRHEMSRQLKEAEERALQAHVPAMLEELAQLQASYPGKSWSEELFRFAKDNAHLHVRRLEFDHETGTFESYRRCLQRTLKYPLLLAARLPIAALERAQDEQRPRGPLTEGAFMSMSWAERLAPETEARLREAIRGPWAIFDPHDLPRLEDDGTIRPAINEGR